MAKTSYDPAVIEQFADALYARAKTIAIQYAVGVGVLGFIVGFAVAAAQSASGDNARVLGAVIGVFGLVLGYLAGHAKAFTLRLQAQTALCQVQIEKNARAAYAVRGG